MEDDLLQPTWGVCDIRGYLVRVLTIRDSYYFGGSILGVPYHRNPPLGVPQIVDDSVMSGAWRCQLCVGFRA